jgi:hypothetical protein
MKDTGVETFFVEISLNGNTALPYEFSITTTIEYVKKEMRETFNVNGGTVSSRNDRHTLVNTFCAGETYYFIMFTPVPLQGKFIHHCFPIRFFFLYPSLSLSH